MKLVRMVRHSVTIDGANAVKDSKFGTALATIAGGMNPLTTVKKVVSSPAPRAQETAVIYLPAAGISDCAIETDATFDQMPPEWNGTPKPDIIARLKEIGCQKNLTIEEAIFEPEANLAEYLIERGEAGYERICSIAHELADGEVAVIFSHGGCIEPVAVLAQRKAGAGGGNTAPLRFRLDEIDGALWECEAYDIVFDENNVPVEVKRNRHTDGVVDFVKMAKITRR